MSAFMNVRETVIMKTLQRGYAMQAKA